MSSEQPVTTCRQGSGLWDVVTFHDYGPPNAKRTLHDLLISGRGMFRESPYHIV